MWLNPSLLHLFTHLWGDFFLFESLFEVGNLLLQPPDRGLVIVGGVLLVDQSETGCRDDTHTTLVGHGRSQTRERDAYTHTPLNDGHGGDKFAYF